MSYNSTWFVFFSREVRVFNSCNNIYSLWIVSWKTIFYPQLMVETSTSERIFRKNYSTPLFTRWSLCQRRGGYDDNRARPTKTVCELINDYNYLVGSYRSLGSQNERAESIVIPFSYDRQHLAIGVDILLSLPEKSFKPHWEGRKDSTERFPLKEISKIQILSFVVIL